MKTEKDTMNERRFINQIPDLVNKTFTIMMEREVPIREAFHNLPRVGPPMISVAFEEGEGARMEALSAGRVIPLDTDAAGPFQMWVGRGCLEEGRMDIAVHALARLFQHSTPEEERALARLAEGSPERFGHRLEVEAGYVQMIYRFQYNRNTVKGLFFYAKMNDLKNGDRFEEAKGLSQGGFDPQKAARLNEICRGIVL